MELKEYKLGELLDVTRGTTLSGEYYAAEGEHIRLTLGHFDYINGGFKENTSKDNLFFTGTVRKEFILNEGDIITPLTEQTFGLIGSTAMIPESGKYIQSQDVGLIKCNKDLLLPEFCYYLLPTKLVKDQLSAGAQQTSIRHTSPDKIKACKVFIPAVEEQKRIASLLSVIDKKIEVNRAINQNLEAVVKQLYDYWFVQFDFPNNNGKPYKSSGGAMEFNETLNRKIPKGWNVVGLSDILGVYTEKIRPQEVSEDTHYAPIEVIPRRKMSFNECAPIENAVSGLCRFYKSDILLSNRRVYFHKVSIAPFDGITRDTVIVLRPISDLNLGYSYEVVNEDMFIEFATRHSYGTEQPVLSWESARFYKVAKPSNDLDLIFSKKVQPMIDHILENELEISHLMKQRNELLPLLMNGQVSIKQLNSDL